MDTKLYIGTELADFNEAFNVVYSIGDIRNVDFGSNNKSYTLNLPLTKTNQRLIKYINQPDVKSEPSATARLFVGEQIIIIGKIKILDSDDYFAKAIIDGNDWMDTLKTAKMTELDLSAHDHVLNHANVENSWTASYPFYRYPMINFGALIMAEYGPTAKWVPNDFIPMMSVSQLMTKILAPFTIVSTWMATAAIKDLFILAREIIAPESFIKNKALSVAVNLVTDNNTTESITTGSTVNVIYSGTLHFENEVADEGGDFSIDNYTVPEDGTYRFTASLVLRNTAFGNADLTILNETLTLEFKVNGAILLSTTVPAYVATELIDDKTFTFDTGFYHFVKDDVITIDMAANVYVQNIGADTESVSLGTKTTSTLVLVWTNANRYPGVNKTISLEELLPNMTQLDFLAAIRDIYNLRFFLDKSKGNIYIEPWDSFLSSTVVNLTSYVDNESIPDELISNNYCKNITLKWKEDKDDKAFEEYLKNNTSGPGQKDITLTSLFTKNEIDTREHPFSSIIEDWNWVIFDWSTKVPKIWNSFPVSPYTTYDRKVNFNTRIVEWKGLTAGFTWYYETEAKTQYPKIVGLDWSDIYSAHWLKIFHYIDKGKLFTIKMKDKMGFISQFITVLNTAADEGFRPTYCLEINGVKNYFFLQKITTSGNRNELELVLKT